mmetsp:Transcript_35978/g.41541  ORF Transcript_35978/g.41541 Transcript_35978/m.41541 type:complete len:173 (+) Transcript_35978:545-1063(+)
MQELTASSTFDNADQENVDDNISEGEIKYTDGHDFSKRANCYRTQLYKSLKFLKEIKRPSMKELQSKMVFLPPRLPHQKKTLIFDLDETLIHSYNYVDENDMSKHTTSYAEKKCMYGLTFSLRPYALECLRAANENFQVIIFTASVKCYADAILDYIDPRKELIQYRLYRDS